MIRLRDILAVTASATLAGAAGAAAQEPLRLWSVEADLIDFGIGSVDEVQRGRVSLVHDPAGDRIVVHFLRTVQRATPMPAPEPESLPRPTGDPANRGLRALWVWNTAEILADGAERTRFLDFIGTQEIDRVFLYLPAAEGERPEAGYIPFDGEALAPLLEELHGLGVLTYALDGDPEYVREENRAGILRTVDRVADYNRTHPPEQRFYGVRYDIEPYVLRGFQGPLRSQILTDWFVVISYIAGRAATEGLAVGIDIPFWLDAGDEETGEPFEIHVGDERRPILELLMGAVDDIGLMAYRTSAFGPDGVLTNAAGEIRLGHEGRAAVFVGVETTRLNDEELFTFRGDVRVGTPPVPDTAWVFMEDLGDDRVRVWLAEGADAVSELARRVADTSTLRYWFAGQRTPLPGDRLSFYGLGPDAMKAVADEITRHFGGDPAFLGLAYHDYRGLRALLEP